MIQDEGEMSYVEVELTVAASWRFYSSRYAFIAEAIFRSDADEFTVKQNCDYRHLSFYFNQPGMPMYLGYTGSAVGLCNREIPVNF